ncbi:hypothetical protein RIF25_09450 [Thermosynechococcaceae cyanobacterium BACA0444]|uniref:Uncharacterized protein n=1 Tax=Pseudocalidococcus azoricus BACA0444 TaxID=2918990 RepID=A0AAE4FRM2_9CYAN|nr:hypothetical protein [Pseudocalidococcus azoricus]MDS3861033.1 hypothetical protein [Pseudocalidococcus azoricus BACA0444]
MSLTLLFDDLTSLDKSDKTELFTGGDYLLFITPDLEPDEGLEFPLGFVVEHEIEFVTYRWRVPGGDFVDTKEIFLIPPQLANSPWYAVFAIFAEYRLKVYVSH